MGPADRPRTDAVAARSFTRTFTTAFPASPPTCSLAGFGKSRGRRAQARARTTADRSDAVRADASRHRPERVVREPGCRGAPLLGSSGEQEEFRSYWMVLPLEPYCYDPKLDGPPLAVGNRPSAPRLPLRVSRQRFDLDRAAAVKPDVVLTGRPLSGGYHRVGWLPGQSSDRTPRKTGIRSPLGSAPSLVARHAT